MPWPSWPDLGVEPLYLWEGFFSYPLGLGSFLTRSKTRVQGLGKGALFRPGQPTLLGFFPHPLPSEVNYQTLPGADGSPKEQCPHLLWPPGL